MKPKSLQFKIKKNKIVRLSGNNANISFGEIDITTVVNTILTTSILTLTHNN